MNFRRILIAVDDSPIAARAAEVGFDLAGALGGELALIRVVDPAINAAVEGGVSVPELLALDEAEARKQLAELGQRARLQAAPLHFVPVGKPATEIVKAAQEWPADIIVVGSHGRGGLSRLLLGSVAEGVMRHAPCPVLVVRAQT